MTPWGCPDCGAAAVHSTREVASVYNYRAIVRDRGARPVADALAAYDIHPQPSEDATALVFRWLTDDSTGPGYVCVACLTPHSGREVPA